MIESVMVAKLNADPALAAALGGRIFPVVVRQDTAFPCAIYSRIAGYNGYDLDRPDRLRTVTVDVRCYALTYAETRALAEHIRRILDGYRDAPGSGVLRFVRVRDGEDGYDDTLLVFWSTVQIEMTYADEE